MANNNDSAWSAAAEVIQQFSLELVFVEPGKDTGLLPLNNFLMQVEDLLQKQPMPAEIASAVRLARATLDHIFDTSAKFDAQSVAWLAEWQAWMARALRCLEHGLPLPAVPTYWRVPSASSSKQTLSASPPHEENLSVPSTDADTSRPTIDDTPTPLVLSLDSDSELIIEFIKESQEHLQNIEQGVLVLEDNPTDASTLNSIFRAFHTFKGGAGFLNLTPIKDVAHELESLLDAARQHKLVLKSDIIDVILEGGDTLKQFVTQIMARLNGQHTAEPILVPTGRLLGNVKAILSESAYAIPSSAAPMVNTPAASPTFSGTESVEIAAAVPRPDARPKTRGNETEKTHTAHTTVAKPANDEVAKTNGTAAANGSTGYVKVNTQKLDSLIDLVGELVISQSMVVQDPDLRALPSRHLARNLAQLSRITSELQRTAMSLRMVPIRATFQKMTRLVRDLSAQQQKQLHLITSGEETELDRNIVEQISDPLVHMIRNAADHGVEKPEARIAKGKSAQGTINLRAFHRGGNIVIQIQDDGHGLNKDRILAKAREKGILKSDETLSEKEICELIFSPGFSTAEVVSDISGRGVGMDVVRRNIEKLRGKVEIDTIAGQGTTFTVSLPLTLAIIDGMIVGVGRERYIIPTLSVRESFRPRPEMISTVHERGEMVNVRGRLWPLLRLYQYFDQPPNVTDPSQGIIVVVESGQQMRCLLVDELIGKQEVVIKSLGGALKKNHALAGGAVLGDGRVGLILNLDSLVKLKNRASLLA